MAISRFGLESARPRPEYRSLLPWKLSEEHRHHIDARMLRLEGRRREGGKLSESEQRWLDNWKAELDRLNAVVYYDRDTEEGFFWIPREEHHTDIIDPGDDDDPKETNPGPTSLVD